MLEPWVISTGKECKEENSVKRPEKSGHRVRGGAEIGSVMGNKDTRVLGSREPKL